ncbi:MAG: isochorismatase family protein [Nitrospirota bacterium]|nr:isochorismatase family protein [Nitrospirota bacterium]
MGAADNHPAAAETADWTITQDDALLIVDVQNDFLPGGALAVPDGDAVIRPLNRYISMFLSRLRPVLATRDWHPEGHSSFTTRGGQWPPHCLAATPGAAFAEGLELPDRATIISKATRQEQDAYSGFGGTNLAAILREFGVRRLFVGGLATDYCVLNTVRDALTEDFAVCLLADAVRAVNLKPTDGDAALAEMESLGAVLVRLPEAHIAGATSR